MGEQVTIDWTLLDQRLGQTLLWALQGSTQSVQICFCSPRCGKDTSKQQPMQQAESVMMESSGPHRAGREHDDGQLWTTLCGNSGAPERQGSEGKGGLH